MKARFLEDVEIVDKKLKKQMRINKGEILEAIDKDTHYELRKKNGLGTLAPKEAENEIYEIIKDNV